MGKGYAEGSAVEERLAAMERGDDLDESWMQVALRSTARPRPIRSSISSDGSTTSIRTRSSPRARRGGSRSCGAPARRRQARSQPTTSGSLVSRVTGPGFTCATSRTSTR